MTGNDRTLTRAAAVCTGHQLLWLVGLLVHRVVPQAEVTDGVGLGYSLALCVYRGRLSHIHVYNVCEMLT